MPCCPGRPACPALQMLSERLIPFVALDVSASRVQVWKWGGWGLACTPCTHEAVKNRTLTASTQQVLDPATGGQESGPARHLGHNNIDKYCLLPPPQNQQQEGKKLDLPVYFGDAGSPAVLHAVGADKAACAVSWGRWRCTRVCLSGGWGGERGWGACAICIARRQSPGQRGRLLASISPAGQSTNPHQ